VINRKISEAYPDLRFLFFDFALHNQQAGRSVIHRILKSRISFLYVDLSADEHDGIHLINELSSIQATCNIMTVALCSYRQKDGISNRVIGVGAKALYYKSGEYFDASYAAAALGFTHEAKEIPYISAEISHPDKVGELLQLSSIYHLGLAVEGDVKLSVGECGEFLHRIDSKIFASRIFKVVGEKIDNVFYNYRYSYKLEPQYVDATYWESLQVVKGEDGQEVDVSTLEPDSFAMDEVYTTMLEKERTVDDLEYRRNQAVKNFERWVSQEESDKLRLGIKILVVDRNLTLLKDYQPRELHQDPFRFRFQTLLENPVEELDKHRPQIIVIRYEESPKKSDEEDVNEEGEEKQKQDSNEIFVNDSRAVLSIMSSLEELGDYRPVVLLFNTFDDTSVDLQVKYSYPKMMAMPVPISLGPILKLAERFRSSKCKQGSRDCPAPLLRPERSESWMKYRRMVTVITISESDLLFTYDDKIDDFTVLFFDFPVKMLVTVIPLQDGTPLMVDSNCHRGVISGVATKGKQLLRRYVNSICFKDVDEKNLEFVMQQGAVNQKYLDDLKAQQEAERIAELEAQRSKWMDKLDQQIGENQKKIDLFNQQAAEERMNEEEQDAFTTLVESNGALNELKVMISNGEMDDQLDQSEL
jgi:hypothetical protein